tara:strand:+ start:370 stop:573 length:204 start_codon:yes stop_codon:yes gene_type:complete
MPDKDDMELDARPSAKDLIINIAEVNPNCKECNGHGVMFYTYWKYDLMGEKVQDVGEEPCNKCDGRG